jgi:O-antigen/teichoic acid export membrane protein
MLDATVSTEAAKETGPVTEAQQNLPTSAPPVQAARGTANVATLVAALAGGNLLANGLRMVGGILQNRYVGPELLGRFNSIGLALNFTRFLQLGIFNGLNRELPYYVGRNDQSRVRELAAAAQAWAMVLGLAVGLPFFAVAGWHGFCGNLELAAGWFSNGVVGFLFFYATMYLPATYRTSHDFARLSTVNVIQNAVALLLVASVLLWGFYGLCVRAALPVLVGVWMLRRWQPVRVGPRWSFAHLRHMLIVGFPIFVVGELLFALWLLVDQKLVQILLGDRGLGLYSMVIVAGTSMELLPQAVSQVLYPRMSEQYGRTHDLGRIMAMAVRPTIALVAGIVPLVVLGWLLARPMTHYLLLGKFDDAVPAMQWSLLSSIALSFCSVFNVYNVVRRQDLYGIVLVLTIAGYFASLLWLIRGGPYLAAFPQAILVGRVVYVVAGYLLLIVVRKQHVSV